MVVNVYQKQRNSILNHLSKVDFSNPISVTLTEKQSNTENPIINERQIDNIKSTTNTKHFFNRLNQLIYKNSYRRFNKRIKSFVVMEGTSKVRHHLHMILNQPKHLEFTEFNYLIYRSWIDTKYGYKMRDFQKVYSTNGWLNYITKRRTKTDFLSSIDWENSYLD